MHRFIISLFVFGLLLASHGGALPPLEKTVDPASVKAAGDELVVSSGEMERRWRWTGSGLSTSGLRDARSGKEWVERAGDPRADWSFSGLTEGAAKLLSLTANASDDEGFTSRHLEVVAEIEYPRTGVTLKYVVWAYPDAPGMYRTELTDRAAGGGGRCGACTEPPR